MRTQEEILQEMDTVQAQYPALASLDSPSEASFYQLLRKMWATLVQLVEGYIDGESARLIAAIESARPGTLSWYGESAKAWQVGDVLAVVDGRMRYVVPDESKQLVKQVCVVEDPNNARLLMKVVKDARAPLTSEELGAFRDYMRQVKYAGVQLDVVSLPADELKLTAQVRVNRQLIGTNGQAVGSEALPVWDAINAYGQFLRLDSQLVLMDLVDAAQAVPGVLDFHITEASIRAAGTLEWTVFQSSIESLAGHVVLHPDTQFTYTA